VPLAYTVHRRRLVAAALLALTAPLALSACGGDEDASASGGGGGGGGGGETVQLGYFPNITHSTALIGVEQGLFEDALAEVDAEIEYATFNSGTDAFQAVLQGDTLDMTFIGPGPALTAFTESGGEGVRIISGAASGGAALVVSEGISSLEDLVGQKVATPSLGNTQDVAARAYLKEEGYETDLEGGGEISLVPQDNPVTVQAFKQGDIAGAWLPEPWASILVAAGGEVLVNEADLWPDTDGQFVTTHLMVNAQFLEEHPEEVEAVLRGSVQANQFIADSPDEAKQIAGDSVAELTETEVDPAVLDQAWGNLTFTNDPISASLEKDATDAAGVGLLEGLDGVNVLDIYDLTLLNKVLADEGLEEVPAP
jgi:NitT/TauT family transport system substrate-binding protein